MLETFIRYFKLLTDYEKKINFKILAFPCNDYGKQEPNSIREIQNFADENYGSNDFIDFFGKIGNDS